MAEKIEQIKESIQIKNPQDAINLFGVNDSNLHLIEEGLDVQIHAFGDRLDVTGVDGNVHQALALLKKLIELAQTGISLGAADVVSGMKMVERGTLEYFGDLYKDELLKDFSGKPVRVRNFGQKQYVNAINHNDITFGIGPAGTGKTYLAVVMAVAALKQGRVKRIILTRPAVEAGESLGFLPGDLKEKVDPYMRPIYDALYAIYGADHTSRLLERGVIEVAPLAYMRGRTLDEAFVILDEAQNTTREQMKMFLTRLGFDSKMIVNGDISQIDLPGHQRSGLIQAQSILKDLPHIGFVNFSSADVVRHPVVAEIIDAYEDSDKTKK
ncbi:PhoH family protein [Companilactobacillus pabuli]|uniref:PhoH-like protein n=2 Tax=Companilactobacillus TaxID=2767879 RepID=A0A7L7KZ89_9LACO|nr:PhoH family protein [Companilactobacillus pabuli]AKP03857.1 phosphate starvation-inducible protein PhoH [Companilactobacillus farciminis]AKS52162.1 phosphate starvation-inducible protein PhoH [Companilactobacillus farciminis]MDG5113089.1 PhoH family protein [Companilactobacillus pabuli]QMT84088.1 PhoH family protein [Companilactobacillus pabuli]GAQ01976.1 phosphate starvation-inducible protein PhoH [Companilactobacillus farciminis]